MIKPAAKDIAVVSGGAVDETAAGRLLAALDDSYFAKFSVTQICAHFEAISRLSPENPLEIITGMSPGGKNVDCAVISFDRRGIFSLITGVLAASGFNIVSGEIFTLRGDPPAAELAAPGPAAFRAARRARVSAEPPRGRHIIDFFSGRIAGAVTPAVWAARLKESLCPVLRLLSSGDENSQKTARGMVNEMVTAYLRASPAAEYSALYPVEIKIDNSPAAVTRLNVVSQDTPAFLYAMGASLSLQGVSIEHVRIKTILGKIEDIIDVTDDRGGKITGELALDKLRLTVLLTKQFTYFLGKAPDPYAALSRFDQLAGEIISLPEKREEWMKTLSNPNAMDNLAKVLGASDFLWEDFIRLQYEELLPMIRPHMAAEPPVTVSAADLRARLGALLQKEDSYEGKKTVLNDFKNRESFLIDLNHILSPQSDFRKLAENLTALAEVIVTGAMDIVLDNLKIKHGRPLGADGVEASFSILGLGKFGGAALGYASDIELLIIYSDSGATDGAVSVSNAEFFSRAATELCGFIVSKKEGIFSLDMRLRPHGESGPPAVSLGNFCRYYGPGGQAHSYERLALTRLRAVGGSPGLGERVERLRDEYVYNLSLINLEDIREIRKLQFQEKDVPGQLNAKYSPGALVDLEYSVQILQAVSGGRDPRLRVPGIHRALEALRDSGIIDAAERERLNASYDFLRKLINGLRMLRGNARDLFLPPVDSGEFSHLARRMGYTGEGDLSAAQQLFIEFETRTAIVRSFVERRLGRGSLPAPSAGNVVDLIISPETPEPELAEAALSRSGFSNTKRACANFRSMAGQGPVRELFINLAVLACDMLKREPDPDMALNNWERFTQTLPDTRSHYALLFSQPGRFQTLLAIMSRSQFLAETLISHPEFFEWVTSGAVLFGARPLESLAGEIEALSAESADRSEWLAALRLFRKREILRIGACDMCLKFDFTAVTGALSDLAEAVVGGSLERACRSLAAEHPGLPHEKILESFAVFAFGKLGGHELNYSSDIDLMGVYDESLFAALNLGPGAEAHEFYGGLLDAITADLSEHTDQGFVYRVDLRLRPHGVSGPAAPSLSALKNYYSGPAGLWEIQAALKLRRIAGSARVGAAAEEHIRSVIRKPRDKAEVVSSIRALRETALAKMRPGAATDVKSGVGGIREIEFLAQGLQLAAASAEPSVIKAGTLPALEELRKRGLLPPADAESLSKDYVFLRTVEHCLQIMEDRQLHSLPSDQAELSALARRVMGHGAGAESFMLKLNACLDRVHAAYEKHLA
jgi:glutamate-ammonia-ligase adenylyltransferase